MSGGITEDYNMKSISNRIEKAYNRGWIKTIEDLERATWGLSRKELLQKDAPVLTSTTAARQILYGAQLWAQIILSSTTFGALPKRPWQKSGYRAVTAAGSTGSAGMTEGGAIPATLKPTMALIGVTPKELSASFDMSAMQIKLQGRTTSSPGRNSSPTKRRSSGTGSTAV